MLLGMIFISIPIWQVLKQLIYLMRCAEEGVQRHVAIALAYLCSPRDRKTIFIDNNGKQMILYIVRNCSLTVHQMYF